MFEPQESTPWYRQQIVLIAAAIVMPPVGLALLWMKRDTAIVGKLLGSLCIVLLAVGYFGAYRFWNRRGNEAQYDAVERDRARQRAEAASQPATPGPNTAATSAAQPLITPSPQTSGASTAPTGANPDQTAAAHATRNYWTNFRGPNRDGRYEEMSVITKWPADGLKPVWKQPVGVGYASFTVADGRAYTIEQRRRQEVVAAYDVNSGHELWTQAWNAEFTEETGDGPRSTPTWDDGRLYALGATGELRCLDARTGSVMWGKNILADNQAQNLPWAMAASPLIVDDKVIVVPGGTSGKSVVAYNKMSGAPIWKAQNDRAAYVSPMLVTLAGRRQLLVETAERVMGLAPENGSLLWSYGWDTSNGINVSQPIVVDKNRVFISSGYGKGAALVELTASGNAITPRAVWENTNMKNKFNSSVFYQGYVYGLDEGILTCLDVNTGDRKWKNGRYGYGQVLVASGHLIVMTDQGELVLLQATPSQPSEIARFQAIQGKTWNVPALAGGRLLVRNANEMAMFNLTQ